MGWKGRHRHLDRHTDKKERVKVGNKDIQEKKRQNEKLNQR